MDTLAKLAAHIEASDYILRKQEVMKWAHADLQDALAMALTGVEFAPGLQVHAQVSLGALFRYGPLYHEIKHIRPSFVILDAGRFPVAMVDYLGAGFDAEFDDVKRAVAKKAKIAYLQVPAEWSMGDVYELLAGAVGLARLARAA